MTVFFLDTSAIVECAKRLVHISSSEVYGNAQYTPMNEQHPLHPHSTYAVASFEGVDALASWNLRHIVKLKTKSMVKLINREMGCSVPEIIRPDEVL